eukprot:scaffold2668_cov115-Isochrysis_galbana.AAC.16
MSTDLPSWPHLDLGRGREVAPCRSRRALCRAVATTVATPASAALHPAAFRRLSPPVSIAPRVQGAPKLRTLHHQPRPSPALGCRRRGVGMSPADNVALPCRFTHPIPPEVEVANAVTARAPPQHAQEGLNSGVAECTCADVEQRERRRGGEREGLAHARRAGATASGAWREGLGAPPPAVQISWPAPHLR